MNGASQTRSRPRRVSGLRMVDELLRPGEGQRLAGRFDMLSPRLQDAQTAVVRDLQAAYDLLDLEDPDFQSLDIAGNPPE